MKNKYQVVILGVIILAAIVLRFNPMLEQRDFWYDEAFTGIILKQDFSRMNQYIFKDVHPPLYYWLVKPWAALGNYSPFAIRSFSAVLGILTIFSVFWIGRKMFSDRAGLLTAAITAFSPFAILYSQEARMYALFGLLMLWAVWFFYRALETRQTKDWILWGIFGGLSFYTHYLSLFFFVLFFFCFLCYKRIFGREKIKNEKKGFWKSMIFFDKGFWIGAGVIFLIFLTWIKFFIGHLSRRSLGWVERANLSDISETIQYFFFGHVPGKILAPEPNIFREFTLNLFGKERVIGPFFNGSSLGFLIFTVIIAALVILWIKNKNRKENLVLMFLSFGTILLLIILSWVGLELYVARYFMPVAILVYLLFSGLLVGVFKGRWAWMIVLASYGLALLLMEPIQYKTGWYQIIQSGNLGNTNDVVINNPFDYASGKYYLGDERTRLYNRFDPNQDFSLWIIINPENIITDVGKIKTIPDARIVDDTDCGWPGINLEERGDFGNLKLCEVR